MLIEPKPATQRRGARDALSRVLARRPVALLDGPPGVGKSSLAQAVADSESMRYVPLGRDDAARAALRDNPGAWLQTLTEPTVLDDAHLAPDLLVELEAFVDRPQRAGLLLVVQRTSTTLPSTTSLPRVPLYSLTRAELRNHVGRFINAAFAGAEPSSWAVEPVGVDECHELALVGGLPALAQLPDPMLRAKLYAETVDERLQGGGASAGALRATLEMVLTRPNCRVTFDRDAALLGVSVARLIDDLDALTALGIVIQTPAWTRFRRSADSVRAYVADPGFLGWSPVQATRELPQRFAPAPGVVVRALAAQELTVQNAWARHPVQMSFWRSKPSQYEVDFLLEDRHGNVVPVVVSSSIAPGSSDFAGIDAFRRRHPRAYVRGLLLHPGDRVRSLGDERWAIPISTLWTVADGDTLLDVASLDTELEAAVNALRVMVDRSGRSDAEVVRRREEVELSMATSLAPRLERIGLVLDSVGLQVEKLDRVVLPAPDGPVPTGWADGALGACLAEHLGDASSTVIVSAMAVRPDTSRTAMAGPANWFAFVGAAVGAAGTTWGAGHLVRVADGTVRVVGGSELVAGETGDQLDGLIDQLCAAVATTLPDAMAAISG